MSAAPPAEFRLRSILDRLDRLMASRRAVEFARADALARLDAERTAAVASEMPEEFAASLREHRRALDDVARLDAELARLDRLRVRALRAASTAAQRAADDAEEDAAHNVNGLFIDR